MTENAAGKTRKNQKKTRRKKENIFKNSRQTESKPKRILETERRAKAQPRVSAASLSEPCSSCLKPYEIYIIVAVLALLALIAYTISQSSLPEKTDLPPNETTETEESEMPAGPVSILGFTELKDQYALCANLLFQAQYDTGNIAGSMEILQIANQKYQRLTGELIEQNPAMQAEEIEILRQIIHDAEHPEAKQHLIEDCTEAITIFEEMYNRQEMIDFNAAKENAGD